MAHRIFLLFLIISSLLSLLLPLTHAQGSVTLFKLESQSSINGLRVTIQCTASGAITGNRTFFRARDLNSSDVEVVRSSQGSGNDILLTFELTPKLEGYYFCQVGNLTSNKLPLVAHPVLNRNLRSASETFFLSVPLNSAITIPCPYERGVFEERYGVTWYQGMNMIDNLVAESAGHYEILQNFSLVIQGAKPTDASNAYYCRVQVNTTDDVFITRQSPFITLEVLDPITISQHLQEQIVAPNTPVLYTCKVSGVPAPTIKWMFNGVEISESTNVRIENNIIPLRNMVTVTSTLWYLSSQESGQVACIGYHMEGERLVMVTSEAHLIVLTDQITPALEVLGGGPQLRVQFPSLIPGEFELLAFYYYQNMNAYSRKLISHPTFRNVREVDIAIPADKLPPFRTFTVQVALSVANKTGGRSTRSNQITFNEEFPSGITTDIDCFCSDTDTDSVEPSSSNSPVVALLAVFIVLLIIMIVVGTVVGVMFCLCYRKMRSLPLDKLDETSNGGGHFSAASDIHVQKGPHLYEDTAPTPTSTLQRSRKSSFTSHGSQGGAESSDDNEEENPSNFAHKKLQQWEEEKNKAEAVAVDDMEVDDETGIRMHSNEVHPTRVEHQRRKQARGGGAELPYITNIAMHNRQRFGQDNPLATGANIKPGDSFEDLTEEAEMLTSTEFPKSA